MISVDGPFPGNDQKGFFPGISVSFGLTILVFPEFLY